VVLSGVLEKNGGCVLADRRSTTDVSDLLAAATAQAYRLPAGLRLTRGCPQNALMGAKEFIAFCFYRK
jgi:hypothetical protein